MTLPEADQRRAPALGLIELTSIARGVIANDAMVKKAKIKTILSNPVCPGKYLVLITGDVEEVEQAMRVGIYYADYSLVDQLFLPHVHPQVLPAIYGTTQVAALKTVAVVETFTVAASIIGADRACKTAEIQLVEMRLAVGIGGKAYFTLTGEQHMAEAAVEGAVDVLDSGLIIRTEIIPAPHDDLSDILL